MTAPVTGGTQQARSAGGRSAPLDGIRALAIVAVMAFHAHYGWAVGGYLGVDVFFVLSGYLITGVLLSTHRSWWGYRQFLVRRAVRLLPALVVAMAGATAVAVATDVPAPAGRCAAASFGYVMNLPFVESWHCTALWHITWSLSAEQQFYLLWPLVLAGLALVVRRLGAGGRRGRGLLVIAALCALGYATSVWWQLVLRHHGASTSRLAFPPDGRSLVLLLGCGLALGVAARRRSSGAPRTLPGAGRLAGAALVALGLCLLYGDLGATPGALVPLVVAGVATTALIAALLHAPASCWPVRFLGAGPVAWLGRVSYSLYLWHEVAYRLAEQVAPRGTVTAEVLRFALALALGTASYYLVELPAQRAWRRRRETPRPERVLEPVSA